MHVVKIRADVDECAIHKKYPHHGDCDAHHRDGEDDHAGWSHEYVHVGVVHASEGITKQQTIKLRTPIAR